MKLPYGRLIVLVARALGVSPAAARSMAETGEISFDEAVEIYVLEDIISSGRVTAWMNREEHLKKNDEIQRLKDLAAAMALAETDEEREELAEKMRDINRRV